MENSLLGQVFIAIKDLGHDISNGWFCQFLFLMNVGSQISMRAVFHNNVDVSLGSNHIITPNYVVMFQMSVDFYFSIKQLQT